MIYKPGMSMHAVGITQTIGRITGCAMPSLQRRLYAPQEVIETYKTYNKNQEAYIKAIEKQDTNKKLTKEVISGMVFEKMKRNIDRAKLRLKMNYKDNNIVGDTERMKQLIDMWWNADTIIGKILRFVYEHEDGVIEAELKGYIEKCGSTNVKAHYDEPVKSDRGHTTVFSRTANRITKLTAEARAYIQSL
jgi:hypothetical protein